MPAWLPQLNRAVVNPVQRWWAPYLPPFALVTHRGGRSGTTYQTPVLAFPHDDGLAIALMYGPGTDWVRNVATARRAEVQRAGRHLVVTNPRLASADQLAGLPWAPRRLSARVPILLVDVAEPGAA